MPLNRHIHLDLPGPRSTSGHWLQSSIAETISLPGKKTKEELEELREVQGAEPGARTQESARVAATLPDSPQHYANAKLTMVWPSMRGTWTMR